MKQIFLQYDKEKMMRSAKPLIDEIRRLHNKFKEFDFEREVRKLVYGRSLHIDKKSPAIFLLVVKLTKFSGLKW